jgi:hypothetical protein
MRAATLLRLLLLPAALPAAACDDSGFPQEPTVEDGVPTREDAPTRQAASGLIGSATHWADGYLELHGDGISGDIPASGYSFNRAGRGTMSVAKPAGTTGRYIATFTGLSAYLGGRSTVHVIGFGNYGTACKPAAAYLVNDAVEVRCFAIATGLPVNSEFSLLVTRNYADLAFAYAQQPTASSYTPAAAGSWNPAGTSTVTRSGMGSYRVTFNNLGAQLPPNVGGHVQVNAVGTSNTYCNVYNWETGGSPNLSVDVRCFTRTGAAADAKFTVLFLLPSEHLAYGWADKPTTASYSPLASYTLNPAGTLVTIGRGGAGFYEIGWSGADGYIFDEGNTQATAYGSNAQCKVTGNTPSGAIVRCYAPNGTLADSRFTVLLGS